MAVAAVRDLRTLRPVAGVHELVLTHFAATDDGWLRELADAAATRFDGPISLAAPGTQVTVGERARFSRAG